MTWPLQLLSLAVYVALGRWLTAARTRWRDAVFALLNLGVVYVFFFMEKDTRFQAIFVAYVGLVSAQYLTLRCWSGRAGWLPWLAFFAPICLLAAVRYIPPSLAARFSVALGQVLQRKPDFSFSAYFVGLSYLAFRTSYLVLEIRNGVVARPGFWRYLGFAFFAPTLSVGPINPYSRYESGFAGETRPEIPVGRALLRVVAGAVKFRFLGALLGQITYGSFLADGHPHSWVDLPIAVIAYYLYLYCNFSGFCDLAIGGAGLMGIPVAGNFDNPFAARNVKDFWNRWHITLSQWMRDVVFSPLSKSLVRALGPAQANQAIALTILVVFLLVGIWHGVGWNYAAFGAAHALGVAANHYYTLALKKWLGKERFAAYNRNRVIHACAVALTFLYVAATLFLFANNLSTMKNILAMLQWP